MESLNKTPFAVQLVMSSTLNISLINNSNQQMKKESER